MIFLNLKFYLFLFIFCASEIYESFLEQKYRSFTSEISVSLETKITFSIDHIRIHSQEYNSSMWKFDGWNLLFKFILLHIKLFSMNIYHSFLDYDKVNRTKWNIFLQVLILLFFKSVIFFSECFTILIYIVKRDKNIF